MLLYSRLQYLKMAAVSRIFSRRLLNVKNTNIARIFISTTSRSLANADTVTHTGQVCTFSTEYLNQNNVH
jgi:hypothetical protein